MKKVTKIALLSILAATIILSTIAVFSFMGFVNQNEFEITTPLKNVALGYAQSKEKSAAGETIMSVVGGTEIPLVKKVAVRFDPETRSDVKLSYCETQNGDYIQFATAEKNRKSNVVAYEFARPVPLYSLKIDSDSDVSQVEIFSEMEDKYINAAKNAKAAAFDKSKSPIKNLTDGDPATEYVLSEKTLNELSADDPAWVKLDLGSVYRVSSVDIVFSGDEKAEFIYSIYGSESDGKFSDKTALVNSAVGRCAFNDNEKHDVFNETASVRYIWIAIESGESDAVCPAIAEITVNAGADIISAKGGTFAKSASVFAKNAKAVSQNGDIILPQSGEDTNLELTLSAEPVIDGLKFDNWYDENGNVVDGIKANPNGTFTYTYSSAGNGSIALIAEYEGPPITEENTRLINDKETLETMKRNARASSEQYTPNGGDNHTVDLAFDGDLDTYWSSRSDNQETPRETNKFSDGTDCETNFDGGVGYDMVDNDFILKSVWIQTSFDEPKLLTKWRMTFNPADENKVSSLEIFVSDDEKFENCESIFQKAYLNKEIDGRTYIEETFDRVYEAKYVRIVIEATTSYIMPPPPASLSEFSFYEYIGDQYNVPLYFDYVDADHGNVPIDAAGNGLVENILVPVHLFLNEVENIESAKIEEPELLDVCNTLQDNLSSAKYDYEVLSDTLEQKDGKNVVKVKRRTANYNVTAQIDENIQTAAGKYNEFFKLDDGQYITAEGVSNFTHWEKLIEENGEYKNTGEIVCTDKQFMLRANESLAIKPMTNGDPNTPSVFMPDPTISKMGATETLQSYWKMEVPVTFTNVIENIEPVDEESLNYKIKDTVEEFGLVFAKDFAGQDEEIKTALAKGGDRSTITVKSPYIRAKADGPANSYLSNKGRYMHTINFTQSKANEYNGAKLWAYIIVDNNVYLSGAKTIKFRTASGGEEASGKYEGKETLKIDSWTSLETMQNTVLSAKDANGSTVTQTQVTGIVYGTWDDYKNTIGGKFEDGTYIDSTSSVTDSNTSVRTFYKNGTVYILAENKKAKIKIPDIGDNADKLFEPFKSNIKTIDLTGLDTSALTNMERMFAGDGMNSSYTKLTTVNMSGLDLSNVESMRYMFEDCPELQKVDMNGVKTDKLEDTYGMFSRCAKLTTIDLSGIDTSDVTDMSNMFLNCNNLTSLDLSSFNTSKVTDMHSMFAGCTSLTSLNISHFDTSNVTDMRAMFKQCVSLAELDLSTFDTHNVSDMSQMFDMYDVETESNGLSPKLAKIIVDSDTFTVDQLTDKKSFCMFNNCSGLANCNDNGAYGKERANTSEGFLTDRQ